MAYSIEVVDIFQKEVEEGIKGIFTDGLGSSKLPADISLFKNADPSAAGQSFIVAAIEDGVILGCNGFVAFDFYIKDRVFPCYQSCGSATHPKHQGRKIFTSLVNYAKEYLKKKGAGFIFGVPNDNSHPIFIKKLGFSEIPTLTARIPNIPVIRNLFFNKKASSVVTQLAPQSLMVKEEHVIAIKKRVSIEPIEIVKVNNSYGWGKIKRTKKFGITFRYFYIGGVVLNDPSDYPKIIKKIFSSYSISYVQIVSCKTNSTNSMIKKWKKTKMNGFIFFNIDEGNFEHINLQWGIIDVF